MARIMSLPKIGVNMTEALISRWLIKVGDTVTVGDAILEAETDKAVQEIYATESGIVSKLLRAEGETVQCHEDILVLIDEGETASEPVIETTPDDKPEIENVRQDQKNQTGSDPAQQIVNDQKTDAIRKPVDRLKSRIRISPLARKMAIDLGIELTQLEPELPGQRISKKDVLRYANHSAAPQIEFGQGESDVMIPLSSVRQVIASRMLDSARNRPMVPLTLTANVDALLALRSLYKQNGQKVSVDAFVCYAAAHLLPEHRALNSVLEDHTIVQKSSIHIGVAVDTPRGLIVPVVNHADQKKLAHVAAELSEMTAQAVAGQLAPEKMTGGTFTITNLGMFGIEEFVPIINPPECCILALGAIKPCFVPDDAGQPVLKNQMKMTLVFDHRIIDGVPAAKFLNKLKSMVEMPGLLL